MNTTSELTQAQIDRQDLVDNSIFEMLTKILDRKNVPENYSDCWNIYDIGIIRDAVEKLLVRDYHFMISEEFYPYFEEG
jgi:hypothetical protein